MRDQTSGLAAVVEVTLANEALHDADCGAVCDMDRTTYTFRSMTCAETHENLPYEAPAGGEQRIEWRHIRSTIPIGAARWPIRSQQEYTRRMRRHPRGDLGRCTRPESLQGNLNTEPSVIVP